MKKKYTLLFAALLVAAGAGAQSPTRTLKAKLAPATQKENSINPVTTEVISEQPAGEYHGNDFRGGVYFANSVMGVTGAEYENAIGRFVVGSDAIYLKNPFNGIATDTWLKLDKEGDKYVAHLPQLVYTVTDNDDNTTDFYAARMKVVTRTDEDGQYQTYVVDSTATDLDFTYKDGVLAMTDSATDENAGGFPVYLLGMLNGNTGRWYGFGDGALKITPNNEVATVKPASAVVDNYNYRMEHTVRGSSMVSTAETLVKVAFDGNDVYINNPVSKDTNSWIKGTMSGSNVTFLPQYIGPDSADNIHLWFEPGTFTTTYDELQMSRVRNYSLADKLVLKYDASSKVFTAPDASSIIINASPNRLYMLASYDEVTLTPWTETAERLQDPSILQVIEEYDSYGYSLVNFYIPKYSATGDLLNTDKLYYNLYTGDDPENPYALTPEEGYHYFNNPDPVNIPFNYNDGTDIWSNDESKYWFIYFDTKDIDSVGVQTFYSGGDELNNSKLVWYNLGHPKNPDGINSVNGDMSGVKATEYYDLSGRKIAAPKQSGVYIKETTYADGTKRSVKVLRK